MSINDAVRALRELRELEQSGVKLPYRPAFILKQEAQGRVVDLETGGINIIPGDKAVYRPTAKGMGEA